MKISVSKLLIKNVSDVGIVDQMWEQSKGTNPFVEDVMKMFLEKEK